MTVIKFILHATLVMAFAGLISLAFVMPSVSKHTPTTSGAWLVMVDWDELGEPELLFDPQRLETRARCRSLAAQMVEYLKTYEPDRRFVIACAHPDDAADLDTIVDRIVEDFSPYFPSIGQGI